MTADEDLELRIRGLENREAIRRLVHRYGLAVDDRDFASLGALFTEDAKMTGAIGEVVGRERVVDAFRSRLSAYTLTYHYAHTHGIDLEDDETAVGTVTGHAELAIGDQAYQVALRYHDRYRRDGTVWRFAERAQAQLYVLPVESIPQLLSDPRPVRWPGEEPQAAQFGIVR